MSQLHSEENSQTWLQCCTKCRCLCPSSSIGLRPYKNLCPESVAGPCSCTHHQLDGDMGWAEGRVVGQMEVLVWVGEWTEVLV